MFQILKNIPQFCQSIVEQISTPDKKTNKTKKKGRRPAKNKGTEGKKVNKTVVRHGKVTRVYDGDTLAFVPDGGVRETIRLTGIDAPEKDQPGGRAATERLRELTLGKKAKLRGEVMDRYGRTVAKVQEGLAYNYATYGNHYEKEENEAKGDKLGVHKNKNNVKPWVHRQNQNKARRAAAKNT